VNVTEYRNERCAQDRKDWCAGPWDNEPDKRVWIDDATGLDCLMVRNRWGVWCGYVGVPPGHRYHGVAYQDVDVNVHGGLTFSDGCELGRPPEDGICHVPQDGRPDDVWWLGFDCGHYMDFSPRMEYLDRAIPGTSITKDTTYRDVAYVEAEVARLAAQLNG
jgi:hypothetical protein